MGKRSREKRERTVSGESNESMDNKEELKFQSGLEKTCLFIVRIGTYLVMFVPLFVDTKFFFPFVAPKTLLFRIIIEIILAAYLFLVLVNRTYRPKINPLTLVVTLFLAVFILTSFTGVNLGRSFWSTNERMTGIFTMFHLYAFFIILVNCFKKREDWEKILGVSVVVGTLLSFYILRGNEISTRGGGTIGNTSFMAAYLLFDIFFAIILLFSNLFKKGYHSVWQTWAGASYAFIIGSAVMAKLFFSIPNKFFWVISFLIVAVTALIILFTKKVSPLFWQLFAGLSLIPMFWVLFTSSAQGATISFLIGLFLLCLGYLFFSRNKIFKRASVGIVLFLIISGVILVIWQPLFVKDTVNATLTNMEPRFAVWESGWKGFLEKPILGWGPENFNVVFLKYFNPCLFSRCGGEVWFDRSHNIVFDTLSNSGLVGLLSYLAVFGVAIIGLFKIIPKIIERRNILVPLGLIVLLSVYFFQNLLVFDMINTYLVFFLTLAFIAFIISNRKEEVEIKRESVNPFFGFLILLITVAFIWLGNIQPAVANRYLIQTLTSQSLDETTKYFQKSLNSSWMNKYEPREQFTQRIIRATYQQPEDKSAFLEAFNLSADEMEKSVAENSLDFRPYLFLAQLYTNYYRLTGDVGKIERAEELLVKGISLSSTNQQGYWNLAETKIAQRKTEEAIPLLQQAIDLEPDFSRSYWYLGMSYQVSGQYELAAQNIAEAERLGYDWKENVQEINRLIDIYNVLQDDENLVKVLLSALNLDPSNTQYLTQLAAAYANLGQYNLARAIAQRAVEIDPNLTDKVQEFINQLPQQ